MTRRLAALCLVAMLATIVQAANTAPAAPQQTGKPAGAAIPTDRLDQLMAPIALYPDTLLGHMLMAATNPAKVGALNEWLRSHTTLSGTALQDAAKASGFEDSYLSIVLFPQVVTYMAEQADWTAAIGSAFTTDKAGVFASIQRLRRKASEAGKLKTTSQQAVETKTTSSGEQVIIIEPANPQVVYVPQYNPQTVYVPATTTNTVVVQEDDDDGAAVAAGLIGFTAGIALGAAIDNDYYYGPYGWGGGMHMYNDAWDDWYDHREDAREDWMDHREDITENRGERSQANQEQRTDRQQNRTDTRSTNQTQRTERQDTRQGSRPESAAAGGAAATAQSRGYSRESTATPATRSGTKSDAFSGYSSGKSERAASSRGKSSRSSSGGSRSGGGGRRR